MDLLKLTKKELFMKCEELRIIKYKSLNKKDLIELIIKKDVKEDLNEDIQIFNEDAYKFINEINDNTIDLILTDPPYIISKETGMNKFHNQIKDNDVKLIKTENDWIEYKHKNNIKDDKNKDNFMNYGTIFGKKYSVKTNYGNWDEDFDLNKLEIIIESFYKKLRKGGTLIIFFDIWKISYLKELLEKYKFKQIRFIEWIKTNPLPINSKINYLSNAREIALVAVKDSNPTFNNSYDNGIYSYPTETGKHKFHPTQKSLKLFEDLIKKHSNEKDMVLDVFLGSGTTALACKKLNRRFIGCEISKEYYDKIREVVYQ